MKRLKVGTRGSKLALAQARQVMAMLDCETEEVWISTRGDKIQDVALAKLEGKAFFTKEIDDALLSGEIDLAVHSFKDVPTDLPDGMSIAAVPRRESPCDALVGRYRGLEKLPSGARVGTASLRRRAEVLHKRPDVNVLDLRGNLDTRVRKLKEGQYDTIIVAEAGLKRLGYTDYHPMKPEAFIPAAGQGAIAVTARDNDAEVLDALSKIDHPETRLRCSCERLFLQTLEGGCQVPAGIYTRAGPDGSFYALGFISSPDGKRFLKADVTVGEGEAEDRCKGLAELLLNSGGREILRDIGREVG